jgi:hypothetical protein
MILCSIIIVIGIVKSTKNLPNQSTYRKTLRQIEKNTTDYNEKPNDNKDRPESQVKFLSTEHRKNSSVINQSTNLKSKKINRSLIKGKGKVSGGVSKAKNVSSMLAANNIIFICLTLPIVVFQSLGYDGLWFRNPEICDLKKAQIRLIKVICIILMNTNCSINIFIYSICSSEFKRTLFSVANRVFCCATKENNLTNSRSGMSTSNKKPISKAAVL